MPEPTIENKIKYVLFEHQLIERISDIKLQIYRQDRSVIKYDGIVEGTLKYDVMNYRMCDENNFDENNFDEIRRRWIIFNPEYFAYTFNGVQYLMVLMLVEEDNDN